MDADAYINVRRRRGANQRKPPHRKNAIRRKRPPHHLGKHCCSHGRPQGVQEGALAPPRNSKLWARLPLKDNLTRKK